MKVFGFRLCGFFGFFVPIHGRLSGCFFSCNGFPHLIKIVIGKPLAVKFLGNAFIVYIIATVQVIPNGIAILAFYNRKTLIPVGFRFGGDIFIRAG